MDDLLLNNSKIQAFKNCHRLYYLQEILGLVPKKIDFARSYGTAWHDFLRSFYLMDDKFNPEAYYEAWTKAASSQDEQDEIEEMYSKLKAMTEAYSITHQKDLTEHEIIQIEQELAHSVRPGFITYGTPDKFTIHVASNSLILWEHKTVSALTASYLERLPLDTQLTQYCYLASKNPPLRLPDKIIYNIARKTKAKRKAKETFEDFEKRLLDMFVTSADEYFYREELIRDDTALLEYEEELIAIFEEISLLRAKDSRYYYKNTATCTSYAGCKYLPICVDGNIAMPMYDQKDKVQ